MNSMPLSPKSPPTAAQQLDPTRCRELLARKHEGRIGYDSGRGHRAVAVNYATAADSIIISAPAYSEIGRYATGTQVSFDLEELDDKAHGVWEVRVSGLAEAIADEAIHDLGVEAPPETWPVGVPAVSLRIAVSEISGHLVPMR